MRAHGAAEQVYFKYCSTFDSTPDGNIGPVLDALADAMDVPIVPMTPSSPEHGRTQYNGYLFVGDVLLGESPMRHHPLTPMTDSYLPRLLEAQSAYRSGVVTLPHVRGRGSSGGWPSCAGRGAVRVRGRAGGRRPDGGRPRAGRRAAGRGGGRARGRAGGGSCADACRCRARRGAGARAVRAGRRAGGQLLGPHA
ncbi:four-carbon acid sugar kinase family protein [Nonomuraea thailandensis]